ncbi:MAG: hypothetical protein IJK81_06780 [Selenomonadaceae bacterium]|nr:hypothetical protein [Selenomonadaceae bacterium]
MKKFSIEADKERVQNLYKFEDRERKAGYMTLANAIARGGAIPPMYAVWIPNVIGLIAGFILIYRASK